MRPLLLFIAAMLASGSAFAGACQALLDHKLTTVEGKEIDLCQYADRPILVVNTASRCGFTPQFTKLQEMYQQYQSKGLMVLGFPSNDFHQELATNQEVGEFCLVNYRVTLPDDAAELGQGRERQSRCSRSSPRRPRPSPAGTSTST